ncbi:MAG: hypothetical protein HYV62_11605, partial [Candidatus Rokubacteria bacterium]|nr:hypothetical protein [Candidatus Rokubacteria bacterium]
RLAAKLTGLRIDVKSEGELEEERRRQEEERARGIAALGELGAVGEALARVLASHGLDSPAKVRDAGAGRLREIAEIGEARAEAVLAAVEEWLAARQAETVPSDDAPVAVEEAPATPVGEHPLGSGER